MNAKLKAAGLSYLRAAIACMGALMMSGVNDPKQLLNAFIAAFIGPILKAVDPAETQFGAGSK